jgi:aminomethyltransferase
MSIGTALAERTAPLNRKQQWREWSGYHVASAYDEAHIHEYTAIRQRAALIDVSPLFKYIVRGPDAMHLIDRVITRDAAKIRPGQVIYTPWCDENGKVIDDGTVARLDDGSYRWTSADPHLRWFELNARGLDVEIEDISESVAAIALQGPLARAVLEAATGTDWSDVRYFRRRKAKAGRLAFDVSRTGYTGDLGYELWVDAGKAVALWDRLVKVGAPFGVTPAGLLALDMVRLEAGLILIEVDYTSSRHALAADQSYSPYEIGLGRLVDLDKDADFVGRRALIAERDAGGPARRLVGLAIDWQDIERLYEAQDLPIHVVPTTWREQVPVFAAGRQVGRATSGGYSPLLKQHIALASLDAAHDWAGCPVQLEWSVEGHRGRAAAVVTPLPFLDLPRKRA